MGWRRGSRALGLAAGLWLAAGAAGAEAPARVVSINLCTDQIAMMLAAPGQLVAVSLVARDARVSSMAAEAMAYPAIAGGAEEVFRLAPDLVLAGTFTTRATVAMLRRLGIAVVEVAPVSDFDGLRAQIRAVGAALGRTAEAEALVARFDADLAALARAPGDLRVAMFAANGWTSGERSLAAEILRAAGVANVAAEIGMAAGGVLGLERLAMAAPDRVLTSEPYAGHSRAEGVMAHPVVGRVAPVAALGNADWVCGTPHVLRAVAAVAGLAEGGG